MVGWMDGSGTYGMNDFIDSASAFLVSMCVNQTFFFNNKTRQTTLVLSLHSLSKSLPARSRSIAVFSISLVPNACISRLIQADVNLMLLSHEHFLQVQTPHPDPDLF